MKKITFILSFLLVGMFAFAQFDVTFNVDMTDAEGFDAATHEVFIAGDFIGWNEPGTNLDYQMTSADDVIYSITLPADEGSIQFKYFYVEAGSSSWDMGEWTGDPNRKHIIVGETTFDHIWGDKPIEFTFNVDMTLDETFNPDTTEIFIAGELMSTWNEPGTVADYKLELVSKGVYTITMPLYAGDHLYKYFKVHNGVSSWDFGEWTGDPNRTVTVDTLTTEVNDNWAATGIADQPIVAASFTVYPNPVKDVLTIAELKNASQLEIYNNMGKLVETITEIREEVTVNTFDYQSGIYFVRANVDGQLQTMKFIKQ